MTILDFFHLPKEKWNLEMNLLKQQSLNSYQTFAKLRDDIAMIRNPITDTVLSSVTNMDDLALQELDTRVKAQLQSQGVAL